MVFTISSTKKNKKPWALYKTVLEKTQDISNSEKKKEDQWGISRPKERHAVEFSFCLIDPRLGTGDASKGHRSKEPQIETCSLQPKDQEKGILSRLLDNSSLLQPNHKGKTDYAYRCHWGLSAEPRFKPQKALYKDALTLLLAWRQRRPRREPGHSPEQISNEPHQGYCWSPHWVLELPPSPAVRGRPLERQERQRRGVSVFCLYSPSPAQAVSEKVS